jgi:hypothetical protein
VHRLAAGADTYGQGYSACDVEASMIVLLTDGSELTSLEGVSEVRVWLFGV